MKFLAGAKRGPILEMTGRPAILSKKELSRIFFALVSDVTQVLALVRHGDPRAAEELLPLVYEELRKLAAHKMAKEAPGQTKVLERAVLPSALSRTLGQDILIFILTS
jgi:hypothetical protein